jgi:hypothetical protein
MQHLSVFHVVSNIFSLIFNAVLISLHNCLDLTHRNCPVTTHEVFNFLYKKIVDSIIFIIHVLRLLNTLCRCFFIISYFFKKILPYILS